MEKIIYLFGLMCFINCTSTPSTIENKQQEITAISGLVQRLIPQQADKFIFKKIRDVQGKDVFEIISKNDKIEISGNNDGSLASGLNWYLRYYCHSRVTWDATQLNLGDVLPKVEQKIRKEGIVEHSYYLNYCTYNYSMSFWDWDRWEKEIDWMALNGVNLPLTILGTDAVWQNTLKRLNFTDKEIGDFIPGPSFNAWWLMGNMDGWGGPLPQNWIDDHVDLQRKILARMKSYGMKPVMPAFYGMVPNSLKEKYPKADIRDQGLWAGGFKRPAFLAPTDPLFDKIASIFYEEQNKLFGTFEYFSGDPFHEGGSTKAIDITNAGENIMAAMKEYSPNAKWVLQAWSGNPKFSMLESVSDEDVLILDLDANNYPQWEKRNGWGNKPFVWSIISNFGGNVGMFGRLDAIAEESMNAINSSQLDNLKGLGVIPEGIENNPVVYELLFEMKWRNQSPDLNQWLNEYAHSRYGKDIPELREAWQILRKTVYGKKMMRNHSQQGTTESVFCARPDLKIEHTSSWGTTKMYYEPIDLLPAWDLFMESTSQLEGINTFEYDLIDITRQVLTNYGQWLHNKMSEAYNKKNSKEFKKYSNSFIELIKDQDDLLNSKKEFMLGPWLNAARKWGNNKVEKDLYEFNARTLITTWSFQDSNLHEYSHREWGGMLKDFYLPRWKMYIGYLNDQLKGNNPKEISFYDFEEAWNRKNNIFSIEEHGNPIQMANKMYKKYKQLINDSYKN